MPMRDWISCYSRVAALPQQDGDVPLDTRRGRWQTLGRIRDIRVASILTQDT